MNQMMVIAKKEMQDLLKNKLMLFILILYLIAILYYFSVSYSYDSTSQDMGNIGVVFAGELAYVLYTYGCIIAIVLGFSSMYSEFSNKTINTLVAKPIYRDSILNGKLLGGLVYMLCLFFLVTLIYISLCFIFLGGAFSQGLPKFMDNLLLVYLFSILTFIVFYLLSMTLQIFLKTHSLALMLSFTIWAVLTHFLDSGFGRDLSYFLGNYLPNALDVEYFISSLSPTTMFVFIFSNASGSVNTIMANSFQFTKLLLSIIVLLFLCYAGFMRRDIA